MTTQFLDDQIIIIQHKETSKSLKCIILQKTYLNDSNIIQQFKYLEYISKNMLS